MRAPERAFFQEVRSINCNLPLLAFAAKQHEKHDRNKESPDERDDWKLAFRGIEMDSESEGNHNANE
ncbi:MAG: hypothetical protein DMG34_02775 [Acidobacteria bacterium]|nr:MAG: hypothetical protein DMG34_02775 [Acidobacteriota bacterium]